jgi:hypothetical protein
MTDRSTTTGHWEVMAFADVVFGDEDLIRAEFDEIIAAQWPDPAPPRVPERSSYRPIRPRSPRTDPTTSSHIRSSRLDAEAWSRERSPPPEHPQTHRTKAGDGIEEVASI